MGDRLPGRGGRASGCADEAGCADGVVCSGGAEGRLRRPGRGLPSNPGAPRKFRSRGDDSVRPGTGSRSVLVRSARPRGHTGHGGTRGGFPRSGALSDGRHAGARSRDGVRGRRERSRDSWGTRPPAASVLGARAAARGRRGLCCCGRGRIGRESSPARVRGGRPNGHCVRLARNRSGRDPRALPACGRGALGPRRPAA